jgi:hypothetical protein
MESITLDELLRAVGEANEGGEGFTTAELRLVRPMSEDKARALIRRAIEKGLVRPSRKVITDMSGRPMSVASYVVVKRPGKAVRRHKP